jgi:hypothetical protein
MTVRLRAHRLLVMTVLVLGTIGLGTAVWAYLTTSGAGSGSASVATLNAPTNVLATNTTGSSTVGVSWTGVTAPDNGAVDGYYVQRYLGSTPSAACGTSASALTTSTSCNDTGVVNGTYTYKVTAVFRAWTSQSTASNSVTVTVNQLDHFSVSAPATATAGAPFSVTVTAQDVSGNTVTTYTGAVHFTSTDAQAVLPSDYTFVTGDNGTHTFSNAVTLRTSGSRTVSVNDTVQTSKTGTSSNIAVSAGAAASLSVAAATTTPVAGVANNLTITAKDGFGNTATGYTGDKSLTFGGATSIGANTPTVSNKTGTAVSFGSATTISFASGVSSVTGANNGVMKLYKTETANITVGDGSINNNPGLSVTVSPAAASKLAFTQQPSSSTGGVAFGTQPGVTVQDTFGNTVTTDSSSVTLAIGTNPGSGTLTCTSNPRAASSGVATFAGCTIDKAGNGYTLTAVDGALTSATSNTFNITVGPATQLAFTQQPSNSTGGIAFGTQPKVTVRDAGGNTVTTSSASVTLTIGTNPAGGALTCTTNPVAASSGIATFAGCTIDKAGNGYTLAALSGGLAGATSNTFNITVGSANKLAFSQQPSSSTGGVAFGTQPAVTVQDAGGNTVTSSTASVTLAIGTNPGGGTLTCTANPKAAVSGSATFAGCKIDKAGTGYTLGASSTGLTNATSSAFNISAGPAAALTLTSSSPSCSSGSVNVGNGGTFTSKVSTVDAGGNITTVAASTSVTVTRSPAQGTLIGSSLTIASGASETGGSFSEQIPTGNPPDIVVAASSPGLTSVSCTVKR